MYDDLTPEERVRKVKRDFGAHVDAYQSRNQEAERAAQFHHNTKGTGHYTSDELEYLRKYNRPALTWNIGASYVRKAVGMSQANALMPRVVMQGAEDEHTREVVDRLFRSLRSELDHDAKDRMADERRHIRGAAALHIHASRNPTRPSETKVEAHLVPAEEILWDLDSRMPDRSDAKCFYWPRWITKGEWLRDYPDKAGKWDEFVERVTGPSAKDMGPPIADRLLEGERERDYENEAPYFYDRKTKRVRMIHVEYVRPVKAHYAAHAGTGNVVKLTAEQAAGMRRMQELGLPDFADIEVVETFEDVVYWLEIAADEVLYDDVSPEPFDGFSVVPLVLALDDTTGETYGLWRNYFDPQREINRRHSNLLEMLALQAKPGTDAEEGAVVDERQFEEATKGNAPVRYVHDGKLSAIQDRQPPQIPAGTMAALEVGSQLFDKIAVSTQGVDTPAGAAEAAFTVQIRQEWTKLDLLLFFDHYKSYQKACAKKEFQIIVRAMPDHQLERMLSNPQRYKVVDGEVHLLKADEQGQLRPEAIVSLDDLREKPYDIDFDVTSRNQALRVSAHQTYLALHTSGVPVDPELMYESATPSEADVERLKRYAENVAKARAVEAQQQAQQSEQLTAMAAQAEEMRAQIEALKVSETARHNRATELQAKMENWAEMDELEKARAFDMWMQFAAAMNTPLAVPSNGAGRA